MSLKEGRCVNCGSILFLDEKAPKGHCLYCDAVFANSEAFLRCQNPTEFTYPNEPQPRYEGPNLDPASVKRNPVMPKLAPNAQPTFEKTVKPVFVSSTKSVPIIKMPRKAAIGFFAGALALLLVVVGIMLPQMMRRDMRREMIIQEFNSKNQLSLVLGKTIAIHNQANNIVTVVLPKEVSKDEASKIAESYCETRGKAHEIGAEDWKSKYKGITMHIATPKGGYDVNFEKASADNSGLALVAIP